MNNINDQGQSLQSSKPYNSLFPWTDHFENLYDEAKIYALVRGIVVDLNIDENMRIHDLG